MANQILDYLTSTRIFFGDASEYYTKKRVFEEASIMLQTCGVPRKLSFKGFFARERLGNNSLGEGTLIPHCRIPGLRHPLACMVILANAIAVDPHPIDGKPVDLFFFLVVPEDENDESYLDILHECIAMLKDEALCKRLRACANPTEVCEEILNWEPPAELAQSGKTEALSQAWAEAGSDTGRDFTEKAPRDSITANASDAPADSPGS